MKRVHVRPACHGSRQLDGPSCTDECILDIKFKRFELGHEFIVEEDIPCVGRTVG